MATLMERPTVESAPVASPGSCAPNLRAVGVQWMAATALYTWGIAATILWAISVPLQISPAGWALFVISAVGVLVGSVAQYLVLRRALRPVGRSPRPGPGAWIGLSLLAAVIPVMVIGTVGFAAFMLVHAFLGNPPWPADAAVATFVVLFLPLSIAGLVTGQVMGLIQWDLLGATLPHCGWIRSSALGWTLGAMVGVTVLWCPPITSWVMSFAAPLYWWLIGAAEAISWAVLPGLFTARALGRGLRGARPATPPRP